MEIQSALPRSNVLTEDNSEPSDVGIEYPQHQEGVKSSQEKEKQSELYIGEPNECHVVGCLMRKDGNRGTATGHSCSVCCNAVHIVCCTSVLGVSVSDNTDPLFCSACFAVQHSAHTMGPRTATAEHEADKRTSNDFTQRSEGEQNCTKLNSNTAPIRNRSGRFCRTYQKARKEWVFFLCNGTMPHYKHTKSKRGDDAIRIALRFLFQSQNIQLLSWGTKRIKVEGVWESFPALMRRKTSEKIHRDYVEWLATGSGEQQVVAAKPLGRTVFLQIVECLTRGQLNRKAAVDYVLGTLIYDNIRTLRDIVRSEVPCEDERKLFLSQLEAVEEFLKFTMLQHISSDGDPMHDPNIALDENPDGNATAVTTHCLACLSPFQVVHNIRKNLASQERDDIADVLDGADEKMLLYTGRSNL